MASISHRDNMVCALSHIWVASISIHTFLIHTNMYSCTSTWLLKQMLLLLKYTLPLLTIGSHFPTSNLIVFHFLHISYPSSVYDSVFALLFNIIVVALLFNLAVAMSTTSYYQLYRRNQAPWLLVRLPFDINPYCLPEAETFPLSQYPVSIITFDCYKANENWEFK